MQETYYNIMPKNFNILELEETDNLLAEEQKIVKFIAGLTEEKVISYSTSSRGIWDSPP